MRRVSKVLVPWDATGRLRLTNGEQHFIEPERAEATWRSMSNTRWEQLLRYRFIEIVAMWEGRLTTRHLCDVFGIGRQ